jgi:hypothetical protein
MLPLASKMEHVRFAGENGIRGKYTGVDEFVRSHRRTLILMPWAQIEPANAKHAEEIVHLFNGRHRFAWMRDHGAKTLPIAVLASEASQVAKLVGTEDRICRVTMARIPEHDPYCLLTRAGRAAFAAKACS